MPEAKVRAQALLAGSVNQQSSMLAFLDGFLILTIPAAAAALLTFAIKPWNPAPAVASEPAH